ncbi:CdaR family transcriptional regulator [Agromyces sp. Soil535]|uniref:PucR family transcriptional regulator n=1 Tax=Agromyces sp. Soil535 TaxID=1736390 RepID=UPI0006F23963|nr:helix-turn-helix domain-containing protein [Agromyces sp. Soil535]KRE22455.1 hypothetical protein ASG80_11135 [Agromyces sp. Soil535]
MTESGHLPDRLLPTLASSLLRASADLPRQLADSIKHNVPEYRPPSPVTDQELHESCVAHIEFVSALGLHDAERDERTRTIGGMRARAGLPLPAMLDAIRVGSEFIWSAILEYARSSEAAGDAELVAVAGQVWRMNDAFVRLMSEGYHHEEQLRIIDGQRERFALIDTVLSGRDQPNVSLWQAIDRIGIPRDRPFVVVAVDTQGAARLSTPRIDQLLLEEHMESAWLLRADVELGIVSCFHEQVRFVRSALEHYQVRAGISPVTDDFSHMPQAVRLARTSLAAAARGQVNSFSDSAIDTVAAGAPDVASELSMIVLHPVLDLPEVERDVMLDTAQTWFDTGGSVAKTARVMFVHPNTVRNRLRRLEALTLRSLSNPRQAAEIYLAVVTLAQHRLNR